MDTMLALIGDEAIRHALLLTTRVALAALALHALFGLGLGYLLSLPNWRGRGILDIAVTLPLVFPPMATGFLLLMLLGRRGPIGGPLHQWLGIDLVFSFWGLLLAAFISGLPLVVKPIQSAFENIPKRLAEAARTLGKTEPEIFLYVLVPNIRSAIVAGLVLALGRALGEVGITLMLGGNIAGRTVTASLEIYNAVINGDFERAGMLSLILGSVTVVLFSILRRTAKSPLGW